MPLVICGEQPKNGEKEEEQFSNFSCMFLNPNNYNCSNLLDLRNIQEQVKNILLPIIVLTFHCLNKLFYWSQKFCKFSAFSLDFQKFFSITRTIFSLSRLEQFWKQNTIFDDTFEFLHAFTFSRTTVLYPFDKKLNSNS